MHRLALVLAVIASGCKKEKPAQPAPSTAGTVDAGARAAAVSADAPVTALFAAIAAAGERGLELDGVARPIRVTSDAGLADKVTHLHVREDGYRIESPGLKTIEMLPKQGGVYPAQKLGELFGSRFVPEVGADPIVMLFADAGVTAGVVIAALAELDEASQFVTLPPGTVGPGEGSVSNLLGEALDGGGVGSGLGIIGHGSGTGGCGGGFHRPIGQLRPLGTEPPGYGAGLGSESALKLGKTTTADSTNRELMSWALRKNRAKLEICYPKTAVSAKRQVATLTMTINAEGEAIKAHAGGAGTSAQLDCVARAAKAITFPKPKGGKPIEVSQELRIQGSTRSASGPNKR